MGMIASNFVILSRSEVTEGDLFPKEGNLFHFCRVRAINFVDGSRRGAGDGTIGMTG